MGADCCDLAICPTRIAEKIEGICLQRRRSCREARADLDRERDGVDREHGPERGDWPRSRDARRANRKIAAVRAHGPPQRNTELM